MVCLCAPSAARDLLQQRLVSVCVLNAALDHFRRLLDFLCALYVPRERFRMYLVAASALCVILANLHRPLGLRLAHFAMPVRSLM